MFEALSNKNGILLVENEAEKIFLMQKGFQAVNQSNLLGLKVIESGSEAMLYLGGQGSYANRSRYPLPALILANMELPDSSGREVLKWVRRQPKLKHLPFILLNPIREPTVIEQILEIRADGLLIKPSTIEAAVQLFQNINLAWFELAS